MKKLFIIICILLMATTCQAATWVEISSDADGTMAFDADTIKHDGRVTSGNISFYHRPTKMEIVSFIFVNDVTLGYAVAKEWTFTNNVLTNTRFPVVKSQYMQRGSYGETMLRQMVEWGRGTGAEPKI